MAAITCRHQGLLQINGLLTDSSEFSLVDRQFLSAVRQLFATFYAAAADSGLHNRRFSQFV
jgi:hypothetical protein